MSTNNARTSSLNPQTPHHHPTSTTSSSHSHLPSQASRHSTASSSSSQSTLNRNRQYTHLNAQLARLNAQMADMENLVGMTAVQAEYIKGLGAWWGGSFMAASKILGEDTARTGASGGGATESKTEK